MMRMMTIPDVDVRTSSQESEQQVRQSKEGRDVERNSMNTPLSPRLPATEETRSKMRPLMRTPKTGKRLMERISKAEVPLWWEIKS